MSLAACYVLHLECDTPGCPATFDATEAPQTYTQARKEAIRCGWRLPRQHWAHDPHNPVLCPTHAGEVA